MSYIIAHVAFDRSGTSYPVNCYRTDIVAGDEVIVLMEDGQRKRARVTDTNFLHWNCRNTIECLANEAQSSGRGAMKPSIETVSCSGFSRNVDLAAHIFELRWLPRRPANNIHQKAFSATNLKQTGLIWLRKNGVDVQIVEGLPNEEARPNSVLSVSVTEGIFIRQKLHGSLNNVFERTAAFAEAFLRNAPGLAEMVTPQQATKNLPAPPPRPSRDDLYDALGGTGDPVYLSDGVWLTAGGRSHDWGR